MCANACTMHSADTCVFRDPYMGKRPEEKTEVMGSMPEPARERERQDLGESSSSQLK